MFMSKLRGTKKNNRIWWIIVVVILGFGLVGSYAVWTGGGNIPNNLNQNQQNNAVNQKAIAEKKIADTKASIKAVEERLKAAKDEKEIGSLNLALGNYHYDIAQTYAFELNKQNEAGLEFKSATDDYAVAIKYDPNNANLRVDFATAAMYSGQNEVAQVQFDEAIKIDPKHLNAHNNYGVFLGQALKKYPEAIAQLNIAKELAKGDNATLQRINSVIASIEAEAKNPPVKAPAAPNNTKQPK